VRHIGTVFIVGAGPGNPDLITVRGLTCLRDADVVLHDRLIDLHLLEEAKPTAEIINVGKEAGEENPQQEHIHWLMIQKAREGKDVCRLKGGDPFVFGRGGEEAVALSEAGIPFEIVPGVSSALAVPAFAGIPVTHRDQAHAFMVITGSRSQNLESPEWMAASELVKAGGTVIVLMGLSRLAAIAKQLIALQCPPQTPVALISRGTYLIQDCRVGTLEDIATRVEGVKTPAIIVIGEVVSLRDQIKWMELAEKWVGTKGSRALIERPYNL
jgi:uroporphyrin-III C-methyltransferase